MPDFPLHPTLFFSLSIFIGLLLSWLFYLSESISENKKLVYATLFLYSTWAIAAFFTLYLFILLSQNHSGAIKEINSIFAYLQYIEAQKNSVNAQSLAPIGMMIAALIASASVMKNIAETKVNEDAKHKKDEEKSLKEKERKRAFVFNVMKTISITIETFVKGQKDYKELHKKTDPSFSDHIKLSAELVEKLADSIFNDTVLPFLTDEEQISVTLFYAMYKDFLLTDIYKANNVLFALNNAYFVLERYRKCMKIPKKYVDEYNNPSKEQS